jgi:hypothetical protein
MIWKPTVKQGFRLVIGSWKIIDMSLADDLAALAASWWSRSWPSKASVGGDLAAPSWAAGP